MLKPISSLVLASMLAAGPAWAEGVLVSEPWARATPPGAKVAAAYLTLTSPVADTLVSITTPAASGAEVHEMSMSGNVMQMREMSGGLALPAGKAVTLKPGSEHIMLTGLKAPLKAGDTVHLHLVFQHAPAADVDAKVGGIGATSASGH